MGNIAGVASLSLEDVDGLEQQAVNYEEPMLRYHVASYLPQAPGEMVVAEALDFPGADPRLRPAGRKVDDCKRYGGISLRHFSKRQGASRSVATSAQF